MLHLFFVPWRKQLSLNVGHLFDLLLIKDYVKTLRSLYFTNLNKIHSSFLYRPVTMCLLRETTRQPPDDHPTATRRPPDDRPYYFPSRVLSEFILSVYLNKNDAEKFAQKCTFESVRPEGSPLTENRKDLRSSEQQLAHNTVTTPVKTITTSARVEMKTAQNHWKPSNRKKMSFSWLSNAVSSAVFEEGICMSTFHLSLLVAYFCRTF